MILNRRDPKEYMIIVKLFAIPLRSFLNTGMILFSLRLRLSG